MKILKPIRTDKKATFKALAANTVHCAGLVTSIKSAYINYLRHKGHPASVLPLGLPDAAGEELYEFYKAKRKRDGLDWIMLYRKAKGLSHCPFCGNPGPSQLEHYLPRSPYSEFTVLNWNLIPTCGLCNSKRGNHVHQPGQPHALIHPYFDDKVYSTAIFTAEITGPFPYVSFIPKAVSTLEPNMRSRVERQLEACVNVDRFNDYLISKWNVWRGKASEYKTEVRIKEELERELRASTGPMGNNSWDAVFLRAVLDDDQALHWLSQNWLDISPPTGTI